MREGMQMSDIVIKQPVLLIKSQRARLTADINFPEGNRELWFECGADHADKFSVETCDGFLAAILILAMRKGDNVIVEGPLSSHLYNNIKLSYMELLRNLIPGTRKISVKAENLTRRNWGGTGVFTGFSAGVDSFCTLADYSASNVTSEFQVSQLLFNNVGSHGQSEQDLKIFHDRFDRLKPHAQEMDLPFFSVNSNMDDIINMDFQLTHTLRNTAVALLFQKSCGKFLYSSAVHYRNSYVRPTYDMGYGDAIGVPLLSTETTECISSGGQHTRVEKTEIISNMELTYRTLDVCVDPAHARKINCSKCWKCLRTEFTLEIIGVLDRYKDAFDLAVYNKYRWMYICYVLGSDEALLNEIKDEITKKNYEVPRSAKIVAKLVPNRIIDIILQEWELADTDNPLKIGWGAAKEIIYRLIRKLNKVYQRI
jgi:hypothetical protein